MNLIENWIYTDDIVPYIPAYYNNTIICYSYSKSLSLPADAYRLYRN